MAKYRASPVVIDAVQWIGDNLDELGSKVVPIIVYFDEEAEFTDIAVKAMKRFDKNKWEVVFIDQVKTDSVASVPFPLKKI